MTFSCERAGLCNNRDAIEGATTNVARRESAESATEDVKRRKVT